MTDLDHKLARRTLLKGAGLGVSAGVVAALGAGPAQAAAQPSEGGEIWSGEYRANKGDVPLWLYRKRVDAPKRGEPPKPVVFLVHGSSVTSRVFDLKVPGQSDWSVMEAFARYGFDCWTMDHENYGKSGRTSGNSDIASGVEDLKAAAEKARAFPRLDWQAESTIALGPDLVLIGQNDRPVTKHILRAQGLRLYEIALISDLNAARLRMAHIPEGAVLIDNPVSRAPGFQIGKTKVADTMRLMHINYVQDPKNADVIFDANSYEVLKFF